MYQEYLLPPAAASFESLAREDQAVVEELIQCLRDSPAVDGTSIYSIDNPTYRGRALVDAKFTLYFRVVGQTVEVDEIRATLPNIWDMVRPPR